MKVLILGASGLLGHTLLRVLGRTTDWAVVGAVRDEVGVSLLAESKSGRAVVAGDLEDPVSIEALLSAERPDVVINALSIKKTELREGNFRRIVEVLAIAPQRIALACSAVGARLIHYSSDGVFSGARGGYSESDLPDASDAYGIGKFLGEVRDSHTISIRTSMIGHELRGQASLVEWFMAQSDSCRCYARSVFSGLPTTEHARIVRDFIIPNSKLCGVYHVAARPISKLALLALIADIYSKHISLEADEQVVIDRSLDASRFQKACGYSPPNWPDLIRAMHAEYETRPPRAC